MNAFFVFLICLFIIVIPAISVMWVLYGFDIAVLYAIRIYYKIKQALKSLILFLLEICILLFRFLKVVYKLCTGKYKKP